MRKGDKIKNKKTGVEGIIVDTATCEEVRAIFIALNDRDSVKVDLECQWEVIEPALRIPGLDKADGSATAIYELWSHKGSRLYKTRIEWGEAKRGDYIGEMKGEGQARHIAREHNDSILRALGKKSY